MVIDIAHGSRVRFRAVLVAATATLSALALAACGSGEASNANAPYPSNRIEFVTQSSPGSGSDTMLRVLLESLDVPVDTYVVNKAGAGGANMESYAMSKEADGYTVLATTTSNLLFYYTNHLKQNPAVDWRPVIRLMVDPGVLLVRPDAPWQTAEEFMDAVGRGEVKFAGGPVGGTNHISYVIAAELAGGPTDQYLAYPGSGDAYPALLGGQVDAMFGETSEVTDLVAEGRLRALLVEGHVAGFEDVQTFEDAGLSDVIITKWRGIEVPAGTPDEVVTYLHDAIKKATETQAWKDWLEGGGALDGYMGPDEFQELLTGQGKTVQRVLDQFGVI